MKVTIISHRTKVILSATWLLGLLCMAIYAELRHRHPHTNEKCELVEASDADLSDGAYAQRVGGGYRDIRSRKVTIVALTEEFNRQESSIVFAIRRALPSARVGAARRAWGFNDRHR